MKLPCLLSNAARALGAWLPTCGMALLCLIALALPQPSSAQVSVALVAPEKSIQPGRPFKLALRMQHREGWHSYWLNAGTGYPTQLTWDLPPGWTAGGIEWPTPMLIKDDNGVVTGHGYDGLTLLQVPITPGADAKPGSQVTLKAVAKWLMCAEVCYPGQQDVAITLPVSAEPPQADATVQAEIGKMSMPADSADWKVQAVRGQQEVTLRLSGNAAVRDPHFFSEDPFIQYDASQQPKVEGTSVTLRLPLAEAAQVPARLAGILSYTSAAGERRGIRVDLALAGSATERSSSGGADAVAGLSLHILVFAFLGGLILNLMPCVFPVLGIKVMGFIAQAGGDRRQVTLHGLTFTAGVLLSFWVLAGLLAVLRASGQQLGWGFQLQSAPFVFILAIIMLVFALSLSGVFEFGLRATGVGAELQMKDGYGGSFFAGVLATVVATPCSAPFLAPALGAALALDTAPSFVVFTFIALGLSAPYLLLSVFPNAVRILPRPGPWMETFKQVMAFPLYATVAYLIWVLAGQTGENGLLTVLFGLVAIAMGLWLYGRYVSFNAAKSRSRFAAVAAMVLFVSGVYAGWPQPAKPGDITWEPWSTERIAELQKEGRFVYVDFTARWCATCQANKKVVFGSQAVRDFIEKKKVVLLKADWTNADPRITAELARWDRSAIPFNLVYVPGQPQPTVLPEVLTPAIVLAALGRP